MGRIRKERKTNPLVLIKYEGKNSAEQVYFNNFKRRDLRIKYATGNNTDIKGMLEDLINYMNKEDINVDNQDKIYLVLDTDLKETKVNELLEIEEICLQKGITIITSAPTFEIWFLMHFRDSNLVFDSSNAVKKALREQINDYKETKNIYPLIEDKTTYAVNVAKKCKKRGSDNGENKYRINPHTDVYKIIEEIKNM